MPKLLFVLLQCNVVSPCGKYKRKCAANERSTKLQTLYITHSTQPLTINWNARKTCNLRQKINLFSSSTSSTPYLHVLWCFVNISCCSLDIFYVCENSVFCCQFFIVQIRNSYLKCFSFIIVDLACHLVILICFATRDCTNTLHTWHTHTYLWGRPFWRMSSKWNWYLAIGNVKWNRKLILRMEIEIMRVKKRWETEKYINALVTKAMILFTMLIYYAYTNDYIRTIGYFLA